MSKYNILFSLDNNLYTSGAPILLEAGALVCNTENGRVHIQLKFKNLSDVAILTAKVNFALMDSIGRPIGSCKKQYLDLNAEHNQSFGERSPVFLSDNKVRKFSATIEEVCFASGEVWTAPLSADWQALPKTQPLTQNLTSQEALEEFKTNYCANAAFVPFAYKDLWVCACGNVNKNSHESCSACNAKFSDMLSAENETLKNNNIYRKATALIAKNTSSEIQKGIELLKQIPDWKDSEQLIEEAKENLINVLKEENSNLQAKPMQEKRKKRKIIVLITSISLAVVLIVGIFLLHNPICYSIAKNYIAQQKYTEAMDLLDDLSGYKDADELYKEASYMKDGKYNEVIKMYNLTTFVVPDSVTSIGNSAFSGCRSLTSITIPSSVTSIGDGAFYECSSLTSVTIPDSVTSIGSYAFYKCSKLIVYYKGTAAQWNRISIGYGNYDLTNAKRYYN